MLKKGILNPNIARLLAETGHKDTIVVSDAGLPMPLGVERIEVSISNTAEHAMAFAVAEGAPRTGEKEVGG